MSTRAELRKDLKGRTARIRVQATEYMVPVPQRVVLDLCDYMGGDVAWFIDDAEETYMVSYVDVEANATALYGSTGRQ